jgi:hypothetical protein
MYRTSCLGLQLTMWEPQGGFQRFDGIVEYLLYARHSQALVRKVLGVVVVIELKQGNKYTEWYELWIIQIKNNLLYFFLTV